MFSIEETTEKHIKKINIVNHDMIENINSRTLSFFRNKSIKQTFYTLTESDIILGIVWIIGELDEMAYLTFLPSEDIKAIHFRKFKQKFRLINKRFKGFITVSTGNEKWHKLLGFKQNSILPKYKDDKDYILWEINNG